MYQDIDGALFIHDTGTGAAPGTTAQSNITFSPEQQSMGAYVFAMYRLPKSLSDIFFTILIPCEHQRRNMRARFENSVETVGASLESYMNGNAIMPITTGQYGQQNLKQLKITGVQSHTGVADIQVSAGWTGLKSRGMRTSIIATITLPTSPKENVEFLFAPKIGNGGHLALGGGISSFIDFYEGEFGHLKLSSQARLFYTFNAYEKRTPGIKGKRFGHYMLLGTNQQSHTALVPAANILTQKMLIKPGLQLHTGLLLNYSYYG